jgi:hypothetical protein
MLLAPSKRLVLVSIACCIVAGLTGCVSAPAQAMSDARQAVQAASQSGGEQRAPEKMQAARTALAQAETALRKFQFRQARLNAETARALAIAIQQGN